MFGRQKETKVTQVIELSDEARQALVGLENDLQVVQEFLREVTAKSTAILAALQGEILVVPDPEPDLPLVRGIPGGRSGKAGGVQAAEVADDPDSEHRRVRSSPLQRRPYAEQYEWLRGELWGKGWVHPHTIAREFATNEREFRYLRAAVGRVLKDMVDDGSVERGDATERGSMFRYRLVK